MALDSSPGRGLLRSTRASFVLREIEFALSRFQFFFFVDISPDRLFVQSDRTDIIAGSPRMTSPSCDVHGATDSGFVRCSCPWGILLSGQCLTSVEPIGTCECDRASHALPTVPPHIKQTVPIVHRLLLHAPVDQGGVYTMALHHGTLKAQRVTQPEAVVLRT